MKRVIALLMENQPGALSRVVGLFSQRGYNIETLVVAPTSDPTLSRLTMSTEGDEKVVEQITKQLDKLIDVVMVSDLGNSEFVERELMLMKFDKDSFPKDSFSESDIVSMDNDVINVQVVGTSTQLDKLIDVVMVSDLGNSEFVERELMLMKFDKDSFPKDSFSKSDVVSMDNDVINVQVVGTSSQLDKLISEIVESNPIEIVRSGSLGISSDKSILSIEN